MRTVLLLFFLVGTSVVTCAQKPATLIFEAGEPRDVKQLFDSIPEVRQYAAGFLTKLKSEGYPFASLDSIKQTESRFEVYLYKGVNEKWIVNPDTNNQIGVNRSQKIAPIELDAVLDEELSALENQGYPFAQVGVDELKVKELTEAQLKVSQGQLIIVDSIIYRGYEKLPRIYVNRYLGIEEGMSYNEELIQQMPARLSEIPFLQLKGSPRVVFQPVMTKLYMDIVKQNASYFNGIVAVQPDQNGNIEFAGDAELKLLNALGRGDRISLEWRRLKTRTQELQAEFMYPYLFNTSLGAEVGIDFYRQDTTFSDVRQKLGLLILLKKGDQLSAFYERQNSSLINTSQLESTTVIPQFLDVTVDGYGLAYQMQRTDYRFNPRKGLQVELEGSAGFKEIRRNPNLPELLYDTLNLKTTQYRLKADLSWYLPIQKNSTIRLRNQTGYLVAPNSELATFTNEWFRVGGLRTMRGFDEQSIFASLYSFQTAEYRFIFEKNSNVLAFVDWGYAESELQSSQYLGFGVGANFDTKAGIFSIFYALGKQGANPVLVRSGKVHFGFTSLF